MTKKMIKVDNLNQLQKEILIGLMLGDAHCGKGHLRGNASLHFGMGLVHKDYALHIYQLLRDFCGSEPKIFSYVDKRNGKTYNSIRFKTLSSEIFEETFQMFYDVNKRKIVTSEICQLLTPIGLAYWAMDDGHRNNVGFCLNTHCFSEPEIEIMRSTLLEKFQIETSIHKNTRSKVIYIKANSIKRFASLVLPYFHSSMIYKIEPFVN